MMQHGAKRFHPGDKSTISGVTPPLSEAVLGKYDEMEAAEASKARGHKPPPTGHVTAPDVRAHKGPPPTDLPTMPSTYPFLENHL